MLTETINKIRGALGDPQAPWYGSDVVAWVGDLIEDAEEQKELLDRVCSQEPCPKCGYGVTGACYGCEIKRLKNFLNDWDGHDPNCGRNREGFEGCDEAMFRCDCGYEKAKDQALKRK